MAVTTATASLAISTVVPLANHVINVLQGTYAAGAISASGSAIALLAAVPPNAKRVRMIVKHVSGATTQVLNYGYITQNGSLSASAFFAAGLADTLTGFSKILNFTADDANHEKRRHICMTRESGTATASLVVDYQITYGF